MELEVLESSKNSVKFRLRGEGHTFCNLLRKELWNDRSVKIAGYKIEHTLESSPIVILETEGKGPEKVLVDATGRLKKLVKEAGQKFPKAAK
ncbi:MAG: DNA-directed RNA polymerase subunit L [Candidatus Woesearchaeota archaeon]